MAGYIQFSLPFKLQAFENIKQQQTERKGNNLELSILQGETKKKKVAAFILLFSQAVYNSAEQHRQG